MRRLPHVLIAGLLLLSIGCTCTGRKTGGTFKVGWPRTLTRTWVGPELRAGRAQDWRVADGRLECLCADPGMPMRTVHLQTHRLGESDGTLKMRVYTGVLRESESVTPDAATGFLIGTGGGPDSPAGDRTGPARGLFAGMDGTGGLFIRDLTGDDTLLARSESPSGIPPAVELDLECRPAGNGYRMVLTACDMGTGYPWGRLELGGIPSARLTGGLALVSHPGTGAFPLSFWFREWVISGSRVHSAVP